MYAQKWKLYSRPASSPYLTSFCADAPQAKDPTDSSSGDKQDSKSPPSQKLSLATLAAVTRYPGVPALLLMQVRLFAAGVL